MRPLVFDDTAIIDLFHGQPRAYALWVEAERVGAPVLLPAAAIGSANAFLGGTDSEWDAVLLTPNVTVLDLTGAGALAASRYGDLVVGHVSVEARQTDGTIVTVRPAAYDQLLRTLPLRD